MPDEPKVLSCVSNPKYKANGPGSYMRSVIRWNIPRTECTSFFVEGNKLKRQSIAQDLEDAGDGTEPDSRSDTDTPPPAVAKWMNPRRGAMIRMDNITQHGNTRSRQERHSGDVQAKDVQNDSEYVVPVVIGEPGVTLNLDFDTGSSDLWVWSSKTRGSFRHGAKYDPGKSHSAKKARDLSWKIEYADGSAASGDVYHDYVTVHGLKIKDQAVETATKLSGSFASDRSSDGLLGLAWPKINTVTPQKQKTPFEQMVQQGLLKTPIFTVKLDKGDSAGFFTFGHLHPNVLPKGVDIWETWVIPDNGWWEFESRGIMVGKKEYPRSPGNTAIADTGTTLILIDDKAVHQVYSSVRGATLDHSAGGWIFPSDAELPEIFFACGERYFGISGNDLKFAPAEKKGYMFGSIQSRGGNKQDILGDVFLKRVYAVFDARKGGPRIGFGQRDFD